MKKLLALLLAVMVILGCLAGCSGSGSGGTKKLVWAIEWSYQKDYDKVLKVINEELGKLMDGVEIEFLFDTSFTNKWSLWMAGKKQIDLTVSGWPIHLDETIMSKSFIELDDLVKKYAPTIQQEMKDYEWQYKTGSMDGKLYGIPNIQMSNGINQRYIGFPTGYSKYFDTEQFFKLIDENPKSNDTLYEFLDNYIKAAYAEAKNDDEVLPLIDAENIYKHFVRRGYKFIGGENSIVCYDPLSDSGKVLNFYDTDEFKTYAKWASKWYKEGYISKDIVTGSNVVNKHYILTANSWDFRLTDKNGDNIVKEDEWPGQEQWYVSSIPDSQIKMGIVDVGETGTYFSIPTTAKYPEEAMKLIELLRQDEAEKLLNTIIYGIEGEHYDKTGERTVKAKEYYSQGNAGTSYGIPYWMISSSILENKYIVEPYDMNSFEMGKKYHDEIVPAMDKDILYGLYISRSEVDNQLAQINAVKEEFQNQIIGGVSSDYAGLIKTTNEKLQLAGMDEVIKNYQKQVDEFLSK